MARRGEGQFVAIEVNLRNDPKVLGLARRLKIHKLQAVGLVASWREFVLVRGTGGGVVKGYSRDELAEYLDWPRGPKVVIDALKAAGMLVTRRGTFAHPWWNETTTGDYAHNRSGERHRKATERALRKAWDASHPGEAWPGVKVAAERLGHSAEAPGNVPGQSADRLRTNGDQLTKDVRDAPPSPPPEGGGGARAGLAEWFFETHPRVRNETECRRLLDAMTEAQAVQLRYCLPRQVPKYISGMTNRKGRGVPWSDVYLRSEFYFEYRPPKPKAAETNGQTKAEEVEEKRQLVEREATFWTRHDEIKARLKREGVPSRELEVRTFEELAKEDGGSPS